MKKKFTSVTALIIALIMMAVCVIGTNLTDSAFGKSKVSVFYGTLNELAQKINENNAETGKNIKIDFTKDKKNHFMFKMMVPKNASAENPVPLIVVSHGGSSTKETMQAYYTEYVRRGFAVIAIEAHGNGHTDTGLANVAGDGFGMLPAVE